MYGSYWIPPTYRPGKMKENSIVFMCALMYLFHEFVGWGMNYKHRIGHVREMGQINYGTWGSISPPCFELDLLSDCVVCSYIKGVVVFTIAII